MSRTSIPSDYKGTLEGQAACARIRVPKGDMGDLYGKFSVKSGMQGRHHKSEILGEREIATWATVNKDSTT